MASRMESKSTLLQLPGEIQNRIYRYAVVDFECIRIARKHYPWDNTKHLRPKQPPLMRVCHRLRDEVGSIYYGENVFMIDVRLSSVHDTLKAFEIQAGHFAAQITRIKACWFNFYDRTVVQEAWMENETIKSRRNDSIMLSIDSLDPSDQRVMQNLLLEWMKDAPDREESWDETLVKLGDEEDFLRWSEARWIWTGDQTLEISEPEK